MAPSRQLQMLFGYHLWGFNHLWSYIDNLSDAQFTQDTDYSIGSVRNHMVHVMSVDQRWFCRCMDVEVPAHLQAQDYPTKASVRRTWDQIAARNRAYLEQAEEASLDEIIPFTMRGEDYRQPRRAIVTHVVNHGTDHRAQVLALLYRLGAPTFEQDMMFYLTSPERG